MTSDDQNSDLEMEGSGLGQAPRPDHNIGVPAAPATSPPVPPVVPSNSAFGIFWDTFGPAMILVGVGLMITLLLLTQLDS